MVYDFPLWPRVQRRIDPNYVGWPDTEGGRVSDVLTPEKSGARARTCAGCGTVFGCKAETGGCWCADEPIYLSMPPPGSMEDCMCPTCLRAEIARHQAERAGMP